MKKMKHFWTILATVLLLTALATMAFGADVVVDQGYIASNMTLRNGTYILSEDVELSGTLTIEGEVTLYLNDHILKQTVTGKSVITVSEGATLNLYDLYTSGGTGTTVLDWTVGESGLWTTPVPHVDGYTNTTTGGVITGGNATYGGGIYLTKISTLNIHSGTIVGNTVSKYGGGVHTSTGKITMEGGTIVGNTAVSNEAKVRGGGVNNSDGTFTMSGGTIQGNHATQYGGGVYVEKGVFTLSGGTIGGAQEGEGNTTSGHGGGVYMDSDNSGNASFIMSGGTIQGNSAKNGGGIYQRSRNSTMTKGVIQGNKATSDGGGLYVNGGSFSVAEDAVDISGNTATVNGGGVYVAGTFNLSAGTISNNINNGVYVGDKSTFNLSGNPDFTNNDVYLHTGETITLTGPYTGTEKVSVTLFTILFASSSTIDITSDLGTYADKDDFTSTQGYTVLMNETTKQLQLSFFAPKCPCGEDHDAYTYVDGTKVDGPAITDWQPSPLNGRISQAGNYYLTKDIPCLHVDVSSGIVNFCFNGKNVEGAGVISTKKGAGTLNLFGTGTIHNWGDDYNGLEVEKGTVNQYGGAVSGCSKYGVTVANGATYNLYNGTISGSTWSGVGNWGTFTMYDGAEISGNDKNGVYAGGGTFNLYGGTISGNTENSVSVSGGTFNLSGAPVFADDDVYLANGNVITLTGEYTGSSAIPVTTATAPVDGGTNVTITKDAGILENGNKYIATTDVSSTHTVSANVDGELQLVAKHTHSWSYAQGTKTDEGGNTVDDPTKIVATCNSGTCSSTPTTATLTISASDAEYTGEAYTGVSVTDADSIKGEAEVKYQDRDTTIYHESTTAPTAIGTYSAFITVGGVTAQVNFAITTIALDGDDFTCTALLDLVYDGENKTATVTHKTSSGDIAVSYYDGTGAEVTDTSNVGTYTVKISVAATGNYGAVDNLVIDSFTVTAKEVDVVWTDVADRTYTGAAQDHPTANYVDVDGENVALTVTIETGATFQAVGEYDFTASFKNSETNYTLDGTTTEKTVEIIQESSDGKVNTDVTIADGTPAVDVNGLDEELTLEDKANVKDNGYVTDVVMTVEENSDTVDPAEKTAIEDQGSEIVDLFLNLKLDKTITRPDGSSTSTNITEAASVKEIIVPYNFTGKTNVVVYRYHNGQAETLVQTDTQQDGTFLVDAEAGLIYIYGQKFSTYAVGYDEVDTATTTTVTTYKSTLADTTNGIATLSDTKNKLNETVVVTPVANSGYEVGTIMVTYESGKEVAVTKNLDGTYSYKQPGASVTVTVTFVEIGTEEEPPAFFTDVPDSAWFYEAVSYVYDAGIMNGTSTTKFSPNESTTRGMIAAMIYRLEGSPDFDGEMTFTDVATGSYYETPIAWAQDKGIVTGYSDEVFKPEQNISREQLAAILYRYANYLKQDVSVGENTNILSYNDVFDITEYAIPSIQWMCGAGLMEGTETGNLMPQGLATRAQVATVLMRYLED